MTKVQALVVAGLVGGMLLGGSRPLAAQHPVEGIEWMHTNLRARGQPVIPLFDGWYVNPDSSFNLCFGYFNMNLEQTVEIPVGPDNKLEPAQFNGLQPTTFLPVPPPPHLYRRYFCTFSIRVPKNFGSQRVVWTLRQNGKEFSVPGHVSAHNYQLEELIQMSRGSVAPTVRFDPAGPEGRGRSGNLRLGPVTVAAGKPLPLTISVTWPQGVPKMEVDDDDDAPARRAPEPQGNRPATPPRKRNWWVKWAKHQGPGAVTFSASELDVFEGSDKVTTTVSFAEPGRYVLRVQAIDSPSEGGSYQFHCCWTNGYVEVNVTR